MIHDPTQAALTDVLRWLSQPHFSSVPHMREALARAAGYSSYTAYCRAHGSAVSPLLSPPVESAGRKPASGPDA